ncbi:MAG: MAPEG family protein [Asticcacaulis sp.]|nr:MAPEG family protein [Asticcacaulis sp.]
MPPATAMLAAVLALAFLHLIMVNALYLTRIPAMIRMKMSAEKVAKPGGRDSLPAWARNVADNYNNLAEAPTVFYATVIAIVLLHQADAVTAWLSWTYVGLRYVHSAIQATINIVLWRFSVFVLSWLVLGVLIILGLLRLPAALAL